MKHSKTLVGVLAAFASGACMFGQNSDASVASTGLLGQRYAAFTGFVEDFRDVPIDSALGVTLGVNLPVAQGLDAVFAYGYENVDDGFDLSEHSLSAGLRAFTEYSGVRPFADATLGYAWTDLDNAGPLSGSDDDGFWSLGVGVEVPVAAATALYGRIGYNDGFDGDVDGSWSFSGGVSHWFTPKLAGLAEVTFNEDDSIVYQLGVALRF